MDNNRKRLSNKIRLGYGIGQFSEGIAYNFFYYFYTYFLVSLVGLSPIVAGTLSAFAVVWDAITDPLIGYLSDRSKSPKGKRRTFIGKGAIPLGIVVSLLCYKPNLTGNGLLFYLVLVNLLFWVLFTVCDMTWITLGNEITDDFDEKSKLRSISTSFLFVGQLIASGLTLPAVDYFTRVFYSEMKGWQLWGIIIGILTTAGFLVSYVTTNGLDKPASIETRESKINIIKLIKDSFNVKGFKSLMLIGLFATTACGIFLSGLVFYLKITFQMADSKIAILNTIAALGSLFFAYKIGWFTTRFDKKSFLGTTFIVTSIGLLIVWKLPPTTMSMYLTIILFYLADVSFWTVIFSILGDVTEIESYKSNDSKTGFVSSLISLTIKIGTALGMWIIGYGLQTINYTEETIGTNLELVKDFSNVFFMPLSVFYLLAFVCVIFYPYSRSKYQLEKKKYID